MDKEKMDAVGHSLGVNSSDVKRGWKYGVTIILYAIVQCLVLVVSGIAGCFAECEEVEGAGRNWMGYPYNESFPSVRFAPLLLFTTALQAGNTAFIIPSTRSFVLSRARRFVIFLGILVLSYASFLLNAAGYFTPQPAYGVYDNSQGLKEKTGM
ncbi:MAG: hypothetical protein RBG13Loki_2070 [Promethearchaeota archaeon CR_4]|nr:MAG: hypothetical protein RBG13Loki_2070 [Candidatus Lokiarchaeota archaeon CR_4]